MCRIDSTGVRAGNFGQTLQLFLQNWQFRGSSESVFYCLVDLAKGPTTDLKVAENGTKWQGFENRSRFKKARKLLNGNGLAHFWGNREFQNL